MWAYCVSTTFVPHIFTLRNSFIDTFYYNYYGTNGSGEVCCPRLDNQKGLYHIVVLQMDRKKNGQKEKWTERKMDRKENGQKEKWTERKTNRNINRPNMTANESEINRTTF